MCDAESNRYQDTFERQDVAGMKAIVYAQLFPDKTMKQLINDRLFYRSTILATLVMVWCS
jgi:hypothetical protein